MGRNKKKKGFLTSSACFPPSYKTSSTLTFSRRVVSNRIDSLCSPYRHPFLSNVVSPAAQLLLLPLHNERPALEVAEDELCRALAAAAVAGGQNKERAVAEREKSREGLE